MRSLKSILDGLSSSLWDGTTDSVPEGQVVEQAQTPQLLVTKKRLAEMQNNQQDALNQTTLNYLQSQQNALQNYGNQLSGAAAYQGAGAYYRSTDYGNAQPVPTPAPEETCLTPTEAIAANGKRQIEI